MKDGMAPRKAIVDAEFHTQTAGCSLTAQQPYNNVVRTATEALAAVLGARSSLHTNRSLDEVLALPTDEAVEIALGPSRSLAYEYSGHERRRPLGGSWFVEELTKKTEDAAEAYFAPIDELATALSRRDAGGHRAGVLP